MPAAVYSRVSHSPTVIYRIQMSFYLTYFLAPANTQLGICSDYHYSCCGYIILYIRLLASTFCGGMWVLYMASATLVYSRYYVIVMLLYVQEVVTHFK